MPTNHSSKPAPCLSCGVEWSAELFYKPPRRVTYLKVCRKCERAAQKARERRSPEAYMAALERSRRKKRKPRKTLKKQHDDKGRVRSLTSRRIRAGWIPKADACSQCGALNPQVHHVNYDRPDDILWLCSKCHGKQHRLDMETLRQRYAETGDPGGDKGGLVIAPRRRTNPSGR